jgi:hypothetical protein
MQLEKFLFCEMARNEANGQISLIGLHHGDQITVQLPASAPLLIPNLSCVVILGDMSRVRTLHVQCQIRLRETEVMNTPEQIQARLNPLKFHTLMFGFSPFPCLQGPGDYEFRITVQPEGESPTTYSRKFGIERQNTPEQIRH